MTLESVVPAVPGSSVPERASPEQVIRFRERVVRALCAHFASEHISEQELDERLTWAYRTRSVVELRELVSDLPTLSKEFDPGARPVIAPSSAVPPRGLIMTVMGGAGRRGSWVVPRHLKIVTVMGGAEIDLRDARFSSGVTEVEVVAVMGGVELIVPPGVQVEVLGIGIMGGFDASAGDAGVSVDTGPVLRVTGLAFMGGVGVTRKKPGGKLLQRFQNAWHIARRLGGRRDG